MPYAPWQPWQRETGVRRRFLTTLLVMLGLVNAVVRQAPAAAPMPVERGYGFGIGTPYGGVGCKGAFALAPRFLAEVGAGLSIWDLGETIDSSPVGLAIGLVWQGVDLTRTTRPRFSAFWGQNQWRRVYTAHGPTRLASSGLVFGPGVGFRISEQWRLDLDVFYAVRNEPTLRARDHSQAILLAIGINRRWLGKSQRQGDVR